MALGVVVAWGAVPASAQTVTNFSEDVAASIELGLDWIDDQGGFDSSAGSAAGLVALALLERPSSTAQDASGQGYSGADATDQARLDDIMDYIIDRGNLGFYAYRDGADMMALSIYLRTGGTRQVDALATLEDVFDRTIAAQETNVVASDYGYWCYTGPNCADASTTQLVVSGLAAVRAIYGADGYSPDVSRAADLDASLDRTESAYATNGTSDGLTATERGHGYNVGNTNSLQQTTSGIWVQLAGGSDLNDVGVQGYLEWFRNRYNYETHSNANGGWSSSYYYYMWTSAKALKFIEDSEVTATGNNLAVEDIGALDSGDSPVFASRLTHLDPATVARPVLFGGDSAPYYEDAHEPQRWYFDYAYTLISHQEVSGRYNVDGQFVWNTYSRQAYAILVLESSTGGGCVDTDGDDVCDSDDNCASVSNPDQTDANGDGFGDACCPIVDDPILMLTAVDVPAANSVADGGSTP